MLKGASTMSVRDTIISEIQLIAQEQNKRLALLTDDLMLLESGLDSLALAILVARLEDKLGVDPFSDAGEVHFPNTLGDFVKVYQSSVANSHNVEKL
jgi:acyl carrier protein